MPAGKNFSVADAKKILYFLLISFILALFINYFHPQRISLFPGPQKPGVPKRINNEISYIEADEAARIIYKKDGIIIDIRSEDKFNDARPKNAVNLPYHDFGSVYPDFIDKVPSGTPLFILCEGRLCGMSERIAMKLFDYDFENVKIIRQNFEEWRRLGMPVE